MQLLLLLPQTLAVLADRASAALAAASKTKAVSAITIAKLAKYRPAVMVGLRRVLHGGVGTGVSVAQRNKRGEISSVQLRPVAGQGSAGQAGAPLSTGATIPGDDELLEWTLDQAALAPNLAGQAWPAWIAAGVASFAVQDAEAMLSMSEVTGRMEHRAAGASGVLPAEAIKLPHDLQAALQSMDMQYAAGVQAQYKHGLDFQVSLAGFEAGTPPTFGQETPAILTPCELSMPPAMTRSQAASPTAACATPTRRANAPAPELVSAPEPGPAQVPAPSPAPVQATPPPSAAASEDHDNPEPSRTQIDWKESLTLKIKYVQRSCGGMRRAPTAMIGGHLHHLPSHRGDHIIGASGSSAWLCSTAGITPAFQLKSHGACGPLQHAPAAADAAGWTSVQLRAGAASQQTPLQVRAIARHTAQHTDIKLTIRWQSLPPLLAAERCDVVLLLPGVAASGVLSQPAGATWVADKHQLLWTIHGVPADGTELVGRARVRSTGSAVHPDGDVQPLKLQARVSSYQSQHSATCTSTLTGAVLAAIDSATFRYAGQLQVQCVP